MADTRPGKIEEACQRMFGESAEVCVPRLIDELRTPVRVAARLEVVPNTARTWLERRGWRFDGERWSQRAEAENA